MDISKNNKTFKLLFFKLFVQTKFVNINRNCIVQNLIKTIITFRLSGLISTIDNYSHIE